MTDLLAPLNDHQRLLIRCVGEPFLQDGRWPIFEYVEAELDKQGLDAPQILDSLPRAGQAGVQHFRYGLAWYPVSIPSAETPISLTVAGLWHLGEPAGIGIGHRFMLVLRYLIERRLSAPSSPFRLSTIRLTDRDIAQQLPAMDASAIKVLGRFLPHEAATWQGVSYSDADGQWTIELGRELLRYQGLASVADYLERAAERLTPPVAEPEPAIPSPLELSAALDYFNAVWQLHFDRKKPIIRLFGAERTARLVYGVNTADEFSTQVSCIADILKNMQVSGQGKTALLRLQAFLQASLPEDSKPSVASAVATLRDVADVRNALFQHGGTEHTGVSALTRLGIEFPIADWQSAWLTVQRRTIDAFSALREEIQEFHEIESE